MVCCVPYFTARVYSSLDETLLRMCRFQRENQSTFHTVLLLPPSWFSVSTAIRLSEAFSRLTTQQKNCFDLENHFLILVLCLRLFRGFFIGAYIFVSIFKRRSIFRSLLTHFHVRFRLPALSRKQLDPFHAATTLHTSGNFPFVLTSTLFFSHKFKSNKKSFCPSSTTF